MDEHIDKMESDIRLRERREVNEEQEKLSERRQRSEGRRESISLLSCRQLEENKFGRTCESVAELINASTADEHANVEVVVVVVVKS